MLYLQCYTDACKEAAREAYESNREKKKEAARKAYNVNSKYNAKQKQPGCKKVRGQSEATMVIGDQKL